MRKFEISSVAFHSWRSKRCWSFSFSQIKVDESCVMMLHASLSSSPTKTCGRRVWLRSMSDDKFFCGGTSISPEHALRAWNLLIMKISQKSSQLRAVPAQLHRSISLKLVTNTELGHPHRLPPDNPWSFVVNFPIKLQVRREFFFLLYYDFCFLLFALSPVTLIHSGVPTKA